MDITDIMTAIKVEIPATKSTGRGRLEPEPEPLSSSCSKPVMLVSFERPGCTLFGASIEPNPELRIGIYEGKRSKLRNLCNAVTVSTLYRAKVGRRLLSILVLIVAHVLTISSESYCL
jgi:16S rRNA U516 pseudouridylate synthase RsuA-like enzyme